LVEYEPPACFSGREGARLAHAREQAAENVGILAFEEGRAFSEYVPVAWDGAHISFGRCLEDGTVEWGTLTPFNDESATVLLQHLGRIGTPLVHPLVLSSLVGPNSDCGKRLIPSLFWAVKRAVEASRTSKTKLLYIEWKRLFGQVVGVQSGPLRRYLQDQAENHDAAYELDSAAYLFALNTYIAIIAKLVAALALPDAAQDLRDSRVSVRERMEELESGRLFDAAGVSNMLNGDFFSWYLEDSAWRGFEIPLKVLLGKLASISFEIAKKSAESTRDLFKGIYQTFVPRELRHALGEFYTPDWLAAHALDRLEWRARDPLIDPTCGTGTFILEALKRRLASGEYRGKSATELLEGLYGLDLNPLAVLSARASLVVFIANRLDPDTPIRLPVFLADAINPATSEGPIFKHKLQTEVGALEFSVPSVIVKSERLFDIFSAIRRGVDSQARADAISRSVSREFRLAELPPAELEAFNMTIAALARLHELRWNGIWCSILAERFAAGAIGPSRFVAGNPPWVKWSHLPPEYAKFIKPRCMQLGVFSEDTWVGGIESDISTVITYEVAEKWLAPGGKMAFFITGTVFSNESSQGFRRFELPNA
jgi:hypothetical protein